MVRPNESSAFIGLGSNLGQRRANLQEAEERIKLSGLDVLRSSGVYETEPVDYTAQPWFLNQVIEVGPSSADARNGGRDLPPPARLLESLLQIERELGRRRNVRSGPRLIDLDLLLYGDLVVDEVLESAEAVMDSDHGAAYSDSEGSVATGEGPAAANRVVIPHPRLHLRRFVLVPLCEIDPAIMHPVLGKTCAELLANLKDKSVVRAVRG